MDAFKNIVGQDNAVAQLQNALSHPVNSYIFYGNRGTFVEDCARVFASRLLDESGSLDDRISKQIHSDVIEFEPIGVSYRIKEDVRESMLSEMNKSPIEGSKKVLIVHDAHCLRADSANTLLKSLEEPPENFIWILIAPSRDLVLQTIHSRCFPIQFALLQPELISNLLKEKGINEEIVKTVSKSCGGRIDRAIDMATRNKPLVSLANEIAKNIEVCGGVVTTNAAKVSEIFDEITKDLIAENKTKLDDIKKEMKDSGYSDKVQKSVMTSTKNRLEAGEKRLRSVLMQDFLDYFQTALYINEKDGPRQHIYEIEAIDEYRRKLLYNPSETLFLESLFATLALSKV